MVFLPKLSLFLPKKCAFLTKKSAFLPKKRKNMVKMGCFWPKNRQKFLRISSEVILISSEVILISSEEMCISYEEIGFSSEFMPQRKEKKYISIYISFYFFFSIARISRACIVRAHTRVGMYAQAHRHDDEKKTCKESFLAGRKKINHALPLGRLSLCRTKNHRHEEIKRKHPHTPAQGHSRTDVEVLRLPLFRAV